MKRSKGSKEYKAMDKFGKTGGKAFVNAPLRAVKTAGELFTKPLKGDAEKLFLGSGYLKKKKK
jgi:hypothetical protein